MTTGGKVGTKACSSSLAEAAQEAMKTTSAKEAGSSFERFVVSLPFTATSHGVIGEIGKRDACQNSSSGLFTAILDRDVACVATIALNKPSSSFDNSPRISQIPRKGKKRSLTRPFWAFLSAIA
jgi:hypothetical protein